MKPSNFTKKLSATAIALALASGSIAVAAPSASAGAVHVHTFAKKTTCWSAMVKVATKANKAHRSVNWKLKCKRSGDQSQDYYLVYELR